jgi:ankyrin repeat protein
MILLAPTLLLNGPASAAAQAEVASEVLEAARAGETEQVEALLQASPELVNVRDGEGMTALHHAVQGGHSELAELLLDRGSDISAVDAWSQTPLHIAAYEGNPALVALLLARGADVTARDMRGRTPLYLAVNWGDNVEAVEQLIAAGADVNDRTPRGEEILLSTLYYGMPEIIDALLAAGAKLPEDDETVVRAAYLAASNGFEGVFRMATQAAEAKEIPWWEHVPMHAAARGGSVLIGEALLARGHPAGEKNMYGLTPLHIAAENGRLAFVAFLVRNGASMEESSVQGMTALHFAQESGHDSVAMRLVDLGASDQPPVFPELRGAWLGQPEPGDSPEQFALGIVSGHGFNSEHSPAAFSPGRDRGLLDESLPRPRPLLQAGRRALDEAEAGPICLRVRGGRADLLSGRGALVLPFHAPARAGSGTRSSSRSPKPVRSTSLPSAREGTAAGISTVLTG